MTVLAVTGLRAEARLAARAGFATLCCGGVPSRTEAALATALPGKIGGLLSVGLAGGLAPSLESGAVVVGRSVVSAAGERYHATEDWAGRLTERLGAPAVEIFGAERIVATAAEKAALFAQTGAACVDMESLVVARAATRHGLSFAILRAVVDASRTDLPPAALIPLSEKGEPRLLPILGSLLIHPGQIRALLRTAADARHALAELGRFLALAKGTL